MLRNSTKVCSITGRGLSLQTGGQSYRGIRLRSDEETRERYGETKLRSKEEIRGQCYGGIKIESNKETRKQSYGETKLAGSEETKE